MVEVKELVKKYGSRMAVDHLSFQMEEGKIYGFLGPNGAGKSTTMNMLTGYLAATEGSIVINGYDIVKQPEEAKKAIGYLPEQPPVYMDMTVWEYLMFAAELKKIEKKQRKQNVEEIMEKTMISDQKHRLIKNLSKGYRQRVGLAQALLGNPEVIILDEPTVGLDPKQIIEMRDLIKSLKEKHTVILSSHILSEVSALCDSILIIANGKLVAGDTPEGLKQRMQGRHELELTLYGRKEDIEFALRKNEKIEEFRWLTFDEPGCERVVLTARENEDIRVELFYSLADERIPIMELHYRENTLEDIFLSLTGEEAAQELPVADAPELEEEEEAKHESDL